MGKKKKKEGASLSVSRERQKKRNKQQHRRRQTTTTNNGLRGAAQKTQTAPAHAPGAHAQGRCVASVWNGVSACPPRLCVFVCACVVYVCLLSPSLLPGERICSLRVCNCVCSVVFWGRRLVCFDGWARFVCLSKAYLLCLFVSVRVEEGLVLKRGASSLSLSLSPLLPPFGKKGSERRRC